MTNPALVTSSPGKPSLRTTALRADVIQWAVLLFTLFLVLSPLVPIVYQSFLSGPLYDSGSDLTLTNFTKLVGNPELHVVLLNTLVFAVVTTIMAQVIGAVFAILIGRTDMPCRTALNSFMLVPLVVSSLVLAFGWTLSYGPSGFVTLFVQSIIGMRPWDLNTLSGMAVVAATTQAPLAFLYCLASVAMIDPTLEDAARSCGAKPLKIFAKVTLPLMIPSLIYGTVLNFTAALDNFSIPFIFGEASGIRLFMTFLYAKGLRAQSPDYGLVATASLMLLFVVALLVFIQSRLLRNARRYVTVGGKAHHPKRFSLGKLRWPAFFVVAAYILLLVVFPIGVLILRAFTSFLSPLIPFWTLFTLENFAAVMDSDVLLRPIINTIVLSFVGGGLAVGSISMIAIVTHRSDFRFSHQLEYIAMIPRAVPGLIAGIGMFYAVVFFPPLGWLSGTIWLLAFAYTAQAIPKAYGAIAPALMQIGPDLDRAARVMGSDWWTATRSVIFPLLRPSLVAAFSLLFIAFFKEYSIAIFLVTPGTEVIGTSLLQSWMQGQMGHVAALASIQIVLTMIFVAIFRIAFGTTASGQSA
ncbi:MULTISPECIES: ABC transporter permease [Ensifer]|jgi:iron(III) transport system permease protein|uniref:ABC transporter permease n=1 Tax=Ensifer TaxID=106591 RepID=UPI0007C86F66|nr:MULTISPECIES: iron ABC transporter permease [Ensifer]